MSEQKKTIYGAIAAISLVVCLAVGSIVVGASWADKLINVQGDMNVDKIEYAFPDSLGGEQDISLGADTFVDPQDDMATSTTDMTGTDGINIWDRLRFGDDPLVDRNSLTEKFLIKDFTAATQTLFAIQNQEGRTIYVEDIALKFTGLATQTIQIFVGTSSVPYVNYSQKISNIPNMAADSQCVLMDDVLITDGGVWDTTNATVWAEDDAAGVFAGCNTGFGTNFRQVPILAGQYITAVASTTNDLPLSTTDPLDGKVYLKYKFLQ